MTFFHDLFNYFLLILIGFVYDSYFTSFSSKRGIGKKSLNIKSKNGKRLLKMTKKPKKTGIVVFLGVEVGEVFGCKLGIIHWRLTAEVESRWRLPCIGRLKESFLANILG